MCVDVRSQGGSGPIIIQWNAIWDLASNDFECAEIWDWWGNYSHYTVNTPDPYCGWGAIAQYWYPNTEFATGTAQTYFVSEYYGDSPAVTFTIKS